MSKFVNCNTDLTWIKGFEGEYIISSNGQVFCTLDNKRRVKKTPSEKKIITDKNGYKRVSLYKNQKMYNKQIHRLVAESFIPNPNNLPQVNHINGNKSDNRVENLEWVTSSQNIIHAYKKELRKDKYKVAQYTLDNVFIREFDSELDAKRITKTNHINEVTRGKRKQAGGYIWKRIANNVEQN